MVKLKFGGNNGKEILTCSKQLGFLRPVTNVALIFSQPPNHHCLVPLKLFPQAIPIDPNVLQIHGGRWAIIFRKTKKAGRVFEETVK